MVNAVNPSTDAVPMSGSTSTSATTGTTITRKGTVPVQNPWTALPRLANQWAR